MFRFNRTSLIISNFIISFLIFFIIYKLRYSEIPIIGVETRVFDSFTLLLFLYYSASILILNISLKVYEINKISRITESLLAMLFASILSTGVFSLYFYYTKIDFARFVFFSGFLMIPLILSIYNKIFFNIVSKRKKSVKLLYLGSKSNFILFDELIKEYSKWFTIKLNYVLMNEDIGKLKTNITKCGILVVDTDQNYKNDFKEILNQYEINGGKIYSLVDLFSYFDQSLPAEIISNKNYEYFSTYKLESFYTLYIKRILDIIISCILLIVLSPLIILTMIAVKLSSKGSILFYQKRLTINDKVFMMYKFRSMRVVDKEIKNDSLFTDENDPRMTFIGRIIRKLRIDEIPQLINVIKGEMSLIGPRPERPELIKEIISTCPLFKKRILIKPGLTGWAQVKYTYVNHIEKMNKKLAYDLYYIKNLSFVFDLKILLYTIETILFRRGAI